MVTQYFMNRKINLLAGLGIVAVLLLTGCGGTTSAPAASPTAASTSTSATTSTTASATLKHLPHGMATISWDPTSQGLTVKISDGIPRCALCGTYRSLALGALWPAAQNTMRSADGENRGACT